jgi:hypothetical protein
MLFTHVKTISSPKDLQNKSDIPNLPTCVVVRNKGENRFPRIDSKLFCVYLLALKIFIHVVNIIKICDKNFILK